MAGMGRKDPMPAVFLPDGRSEPMNAPIDITGVTLRTARLTLRPWRESDLDDLYAYARVEGVGQMAGWTPHRSIDESRGILDMFIREKKTFALEYQGKVVGSLGIETYVPERYPELALEDKRGREIGYVLSRSCWGRGLMPEAVRAVIRWLFDVEKLDFIIIGHFDWNRQSARVIEKCGFQYVKTIPSQAEFGRTERSMEYILYNR